MKRIAVLCAGVLGWSCIAVHADGEAAYYYAGVGAGSAMLESDDSDFDADATAYRLFAGFALNPYFGAEAGYFDTATADDRLGNAIVEAGLNGVDLSLRGIWPVNDVFSVFARAGAALYDVDTTAKLGSIRTEIDPSGIGTGFVYAAGAEVLFGGKAGLSLEYAAVDVSRSDVSLLLLNGVWKF